MIGNDVKQVLRALAAVVMVVATATATAAGYFAQAGKIYDGNGQEVPVRGISHHGFNSTILQPQFL